MKTVSEVNNYNGKLQKPIGSGFGARSTASDVMKGINLKGKIAIVTGGTAGIGLETTRVLAAAGATVIVPARDVEKAKKNLEGIANVELAVLDLIDHKSIDAFAEKFLASERPLHLLINNAGIMWVPLRRDNRGFESQLATASFGQLYYNFVKQEPDSDLFEGTNTMHNFGASFQFTTFEIGVQYFIRNGE